MSRVRGCQALIEFLSSETNGGIPDEFIQNLDATSTPPSSPVASTSAVLQSKENQPRQENNYSSRKHYVRCICGKARHKNKLVCSFCGFNKTRRLAIDWGAIRKRAPKSPSYTTKRLFDRVFQLHAAHDRDVLVLIHTKDGQGEKFRYYATPGRAEVFLSGKLGSTIKSAWCSVHHPEFKIQDDSDSGPSKRKKRKYTKKVGLNIGNENAAIPSDSGSDSENDGRVYEVDKVLKKRLSETGQMEYLVKWRGWSSYYNSWEPETNIIDKSLIERL